MKKNRNMKITAAVLTIFAVMLATVIIFLTRQRVLGNMNHTSKEAQTTATEISFSGKKGDRMKVSLRTTVESGTVDFYLSDSKGEIVAEFDRAKALETFVDIAWDDTYTLTAECKDFTGKFSAKVSQKRW